jgi:hypothetical protein
VIALANREGDVVRGVARGVDDVDGQLADGEGVTVTHRQRLVGHLHIARNDVGGAVPPGQFQAAGDVVVVDVGLSHVRQRQAVLGEQFVDPVEVPLRIDDEGGRAVMGDIAAVTQSAGIQRDDVGRCGVLHGVLRKERRQ